MSTPGSTGKRGKWLSRMASVFGTFRNPRQFMGDCGFEGSADARLPAMLAFADVNRPLYGRASRGVKPPQAASGERVLSM